MLTGIDLVKWQIRIAAGISIPFTQESIHLSGSAIECRINALSPGRLNMLHVPGGLFVRFDTYLVQDVSVSPYYDSLLGKLIVFSGTREEAVRKMKAAICELVIDGIPTNIGQQLQIISDSRFMTGRYDTSFIE
ncbi:MAG: acetyl-CoA carboxylase biotin carboxylase subunit, partial [Oscillospiraceae bacterium]|nr:acetyl-CoA carboxylase biotin carboxylase subunit [Oscillospiraceae bacterium]